MEGVFDTTDYVDPRPERERRSAISSALRIGAALLLALDIMLIACTFGVAYAESLRLAADEPARR